MGEVFLALDPALGRQVAIKVLNADLLGNEAMRARFLAEARTVAALNHPSIVTLYEAGFTEEAIPGFASGTPYFVMEYVEGRSLQELLRQKRMDLPEIARLSVQIADGLRAADEKRLGHRDIKPSNLMVKPDGRTKIMDFGLSKILRGDEFVGKNLTRDGMVAGTPEYVSPEQALGEPVDGRSDIFSFGIVLYEMLAGKYPFGGDSAEQKMVSIVTQEIARPKGTEALPEPWDGIVQRALAKSKETRYVDAAALLAVGESAKARLLLTSMTSIPALAPAVLGHKKWAPLVLLAGLAAAVLLVVVASRSLRKTAAPGDSLPSGPLSAVQITSSSGLDVHPSFSPDGSSLAFASDRSGSFEIFVRQLVAGGGEIPVTNDGNQNLEPTFSPDGLSIAFTSQVRGGIWIVPALGGSPRRVSEIGSNPAFSPDGKTLVFQSDPLHDLNAGAFAALPPSVLYTVSVAGGTPVPLTSPGEPAGGHGAPTFSPDGRTIAFVTYVRPRSEVWTVPAAGGKPKLLAKALFSYFDPVFSPDGKALYFAAAAPNAPSGAGLGLFRLRLDAPEATPEEVLNPATATPRGIAVSRDGLKLAYGALVTASNLFSLDVASGRASQLTSGSARSSRPAFSPDGSRLVYCSWRTGANNDIYLRDENGVATQITTDPGNDDFPWFFPDGERIAFASSRKGPLGLFELHLKTRTEKQLATFLPEGVESPRLSPDGRFVAFNSRRDGTTTNVWVMGAAGENPRKLTNDPELAAFPSFSPDGKAIAFEVKRGDVYQVAEVPFEGGEPRMLTKAKGVHWPYGFTPDGRQVLFAGQRGGVWGLYGVDRRTLEEKRYFNEGRLSSYLRYPVMSPSGKTIVFEKAETMGNVWVASFGPQNAKTPGP